MIVAIDGPAGAGKSTVTARLAEALGFVRLDTGALYRTVALAATRAGLEPDDPSLGGFVAGLDIVVRPDGILLGGEDVSLAIRTPEMSVASSRFAAVPCVRAGLLDLQRGLGRARDSVLDGRDIGTVVFPDAEAKIFLTASVRARAQRRLDELQGRGVDADLATVMAEIEARDRADSERAVAPLRKADDAVEIDTTCLDFDAVVEACRRVVEAARATRG